MKLPHNIEKSTERYGARYVGHAAGTVWAIHKCHRGWIAYCGGQSFTRRTFAEISVGLYVTAAFIELHRGRA